MHFKTCFQCRGFPFVVGLPWLVVVDWPAATQGLVLLRDGEFEIIGFYNFGSSRTVACTFLGSHSRPEVGRSDGKADPFYVRRSPRPRFPFLPFQRAERPTRSTVASTGYRVRGYLELQCEFLGWLLTLHCRYGDFRLEILVGSFAPGGTLCLGYRFSTWSVLFSPRAWHDARLHT